jgi:hypothetical protein
MSSIVRYLNFILCMSLLFLSSCAVRQMDYGAYRAHMPKSILIIPPLNETTATNADYKYLSTITEVVAEKGYYVFPLALVDLIFKENGVISPVEMRQVSRDKLREIFGADAILDIRIKSWGTKYLMLSSYTEVTLSFELSDLNSGVSLWSDTITIHDNQNNSGQGDLAGMLIGSLIHAIASKLTEPEIGLARQANIQALDSQSGLLPGPRVLIRPN